MERAPSVFFLKGTAWTDAPARHAAGEVAGELGPYSANRLTDGGFDVRVSDALQRGAWAWPRVRQVLRRLELSRVQLRGLGPALGSPRELRRADAVIGLFEDQGAFAAVLRTTPLRRLVPGPLLIIACWLAESAQSAGPKELAGLRRVLSGCDGLVYFSHNQTAVYRDLLGVPEERLFPVTFGIDAAFYARSGSAGGPGAVDGPRGSGPPGGYLFAIGQDFARDHPLLAEAAGTLGARTLVYDPREPPAGLPACVEWHRERIDHREYRRLLHGADAVVVPTRPVAYPSGQTVVLEAMAAGAPVITTDTPAMRDYVQDGVSALLCAPGNRDALAGAIRRLREDPGLARAMAERAETVAVRDFTHARMWAQVGEVLGALGVSPDGAAAQAGARAGA